MNNKKKVSNKTIISIILVATLIIGLWLLAYTITYGPVPIVTTDDSVLTFHGGKEQTVSAQKEITITAYDREIDFLEIGGQLYLNGNPTDGLGERLKMSVLYMSNIYYIGDFTDGYQYVNINNCDLFPITNDTKLALKFDFTVPSQYCTCKGDYTFTFNETLRIGMETGITLW